MRGEEYIYTIKNSKKDQLDFIAFSGRVVLDPETHSVRLFTSESAFAWFVGGNEIAVIGLRVAYSKSITESLTCEEDGYAGEKEFHSHR